MTYEDRKQYRELGDRLTALRERLADRSLWETVTCEEALELIEVVERMLERLSPDRWDHMLDAIANEAARRAGAIAPARGP